MLWLSVLFDYIEREDGPTVLGLFTDKAQAVKVIYDYLDDPELVSEEVDNAVNIGYKRKKHLDYFAQAVGIEIDKEQHFNI